jgi:crotonobetainyl-CoA:carnitine CoA-transferase CaiB-like acyl-CoA transferase
MAFQSPKIMEHVLQGSFRKMYVPLDAIPTQDGSLAIAVQDNEQFGDLCRALGREDVATNPMFDSKDKRVEHEDVVMGILREEFARYSTSELVERLSRADVMHSRILTYSEVVAHPQVAQSGAVAWVSHDSMDRPVPLIDAPGVDPSTNAKRCRQAPHLGQHSNEVLQEYEVPQASIERMQQRGAVLSPPLSVNAARP